MTHTFEHLRLGRPVLNGPTEQDLPIPSTLYEILEDFINDNRDELILEIQKVKTSNAIACFVSRDVDSDKHERLGFNFLLRNDDSIELILDEDKDDDEDSETQSDEPPEVIG